MRGTKSHSRCHGVTTLSYRSLIPLHFHCNCLKISILPWIKQSSNKTEVSSTVHDQRTFSSRIGKRGNRLCGMKWSLLFYSPMRVCSRARLLMCADCLRYLPMSCIVIDLEYLKFIFVSRTWPPNATVSMTPVHAFRS